MEGDELDGVVELDVDAHALLEVFSLELVFPLEQVVVLEVVLRFAENQ